MKLPECGEFGSMALGHGAFVEHGKAREYKRPVNIRYHAIRVGSEGAILIDVSDEGVGMFTSGCQWEALVKAKLPYPDPSVKDEMPVFKHIDGTEFSLIRSYAVVSQGAMGAFVVCGIECVHEGNDMKTGFDRQ